MDLDILKQRLQDPVRSRLKQVRDPTTFDKDKQGHVIKLIVGIIQEYGALTINEIVVLLSRFDVAISSEMVASYLLCATRVEWIVKKRQGFGNYYIAKSNPDLKDAATNIYKESVAVKNKTRRRLDIREHWKQNDSLRYAGIREVLGGVGL